VCEFVVSGNNTATGRQVVQDRKNDTIRYYYTYLHGQFINVYLAAKPVSVLRLTLHIVGAVDRNYEFTILYWYLRYISTIRIIHYIPV
jgi:hypothetical protein